MRYYFYNANSHNNFIDDCFPRAYSVVMDLTWKEAYRELCKSAMEQGQMMDNAVFVRNFLDNKFIFGTGIGLDFVTYYDKVLRLEYGVNDMGETGLFIHFVAPI